MKLAYVEIMQLFTYRHITFNTLSLKQLTDLSLFLLGE